MNVYGQEIARLETNPLSRSSLNVGQVGDGIDLLIELSQLRRAYVDLEANYANYRTTAEIDLKNAVNDLNEIKQAEVDFWQDAYEQENKWYKSFWAGLAAGFIAAVAIVYAVN
ncbi:MAG: hypothetical protein GY804_09720 [Alphaproteobacteria bacterium]|nr:hypothetical protein [Alphaproteobacteria bacterium]